MHQLLTVKLIVNGKKQPKGTQNGGHTRKLSGQLLIADADDVFFL
jgi:hypothetical protein